MNLRGLTILVIDDEAAHVFCRMIRQLGGACEAVPSMTEAKERIAEDPGWFDCILVDLLLNGNGADLIRELRLTRPGLPCVLTSGVDLDILGKEGIDVVFLPKPFYANDFARAVLEAIGKADTEPPTQPG